MPRHLSASALRAADPLLLFEVEIAGLTLRWATETVNVPNGSSWLHYLGGLDVDVSQVLASLGDAQDAASVSMAIHTDVDLAALVAEGHDLATSRGELSVLPAGADYAGRVVLVQGEVSQPEYGAIGEALAFTLTGDVWSERGYTHPADTKLIGRFYVREIGGTVNREVIVFGQDGLYPPLVIGRCGVNSGVQGGSPVIPITMWNPTTLTFESKLIVALGEVAALTATLWVLDTTDTYASDVVDIEQFEMVETGYVLAITRSYGLLTPDLAAERYRLCWDQGAGGLKVDGVELRYAGDVLRWAASKSTIPWDVGRLSAVAARLRVPLDGYINAPTKVMDWISDALLPILPISLQSLGDGMAPVYWDGFARKEHASARLVEGESCTRTTRVGYPTHARDLCARVEVAYVRADTGYLRSWELTSRRALDDEVDEGRTRSVSAVSEVTDSNWRRWAEEDRIVRVESAMIEADNTAGWVAQNVLQAQGLSVRQFDATVADDLAWLDVGDVVLYTADDLHLNDALVAVVGWRLGQAGELVLTLQIEAGLLRQTPSTGPDPLDEVPWHFTV